MYNGREHHLAHKKKIKATQPDVTNRLSIVKQNTHELISGRLIELNVKYTKNHAKFERKEKVKMLTHKQLKVFHTNLLRLAGQMNISELPCKQFFFFNKL